MLTRPIPKTGERLPAIGLGTWSTFDVSDPAPLAPVMQEFWAKGGRVIDSSPMYGRAEGVVGALTQNVRPLFFATKVWTTGKERGIGEMTRSMSRMGVQVMDLMQVHNLLDVDIHLETLHEWRAQGVVRYLGITHYQLSAFKEMERLLKTADLDFIQLPYSAATRDAEQRLLKVAEETKTAVLVMRPLEEGAIFRSVKAKKLPDFAKALAVESWSELFLKFVLAHPAVTCAIPATSNLGHLRQNLRAMEGPLPDRTLCEKIAAVLR